MIVESQGAIRVICQLGLAGSRTQRNVKKTRKTKRELEKAKQMQENSSLPKPRKLKKTRTSRENLQNQEKAQKQANSSKPCKSKRTRAHRGREN